MWDTARYLGDIAGNVVYALLSAFVMIFLTDTVGMNAGVVGTLIAVSKLFDGVSDVFFGSLIDKTQTKMGKARPWMFYGYFGCALCLVAIFCIPANISATSQYAWFFIAYTMLNAGFYTANNIAYSALTALITKNNHERVQMGSIRFMFAFGTSMLIQTITVELVAHFGGGAAAWRTVAIIYAVFGIISNTISVMSVKELTPEELAEGETVHGQAAEDHTNEKYSLADAFKLLIKNKYYLMICGSYILMQIYTATLNMGIYYMTYVLKRVCAYSMPRRGKRSARTYPVCAYSMPKSRKRSARTYKVCAYSMPKSGKRSARTYPVCAYSMPKSGKRSACTYRVCAHSSSTVICESICRAGSLTQSVSNIELHEPGVIKLFCLQNS